MSTFMDLLARRVGYKSYNIYLQSEHWKSFCKSVICKSCYCCGKSADLQVHHKTYKNLGKEIPDDVVTVCDKCHVDIHELARNGIHLSEAHHVYKQQVARTPDKDKSRWVSFLKLVNRSAKQTIEQLRGFLIEKGLSDGERATELAYKLGFVKLIEGHEKWHRDRYINMMQADKKYKKLKEQGKTVHRAILRRALIK